MSSKVATRVTQQVKPLLSLDHAEARRRVLGLYKAWYRQLPYVIHLYDIPKSREQLHEKLRSEFVRNRQVTDIRVIDMLVIKGQMELKETVMNWKNKSHVMAFFKDTVEPKPTDFLSKFIAGN